MWGEVASLIKKGKKFLITTHLNPDGDAIGSELALHAFLSSMGKEVRVINVNPTPPHYRFLDTNDVIEVFAAGTSKSDCFDCDIIFVLDISTSKRLGPLGNIVLSSPARKICIDHHQSNDRFADVNVISTGVCATGELIYDLIMFMRGWLDSDVALPLYVSVMTDTGTFRFSNTNDRTHLIASHLVNSGVNPRDVYEQIYENNSVGQVRLLSKILGTLEVTEDGRIAWIKVSRSMFEDTGSNPEDLEGMIDYLRMIGGVEVCLLFLEREMGGTKVSFRSKGDFDVNLFASRYGGGGHQHASGMVLEDDLDKSASRVIEDLMQSMNPDSHGETGVGAGTLGDGNDGSSGA
ncbi:MAG: bifunctional oligoribonuclease/PAP phosphatase NrnA [Candidatus Glassbacteria bacterium]